MKKGFLVAIFSLLTLFVQAQTFVCTDVKIYSHNGKSASANYIQKTKAKSLGAKATLTFYDNCVKISDSQGNSIVLDKSPGKDDEYFATKRLLTGNVSKIVLKLYKTVGYIRSITSTLYFDNKVEEKYTLKRD